MSAVRLVVMVVLAGVGVGCGGAPTPTATPDKPGMAGTMDIPAGMPGGPPAPAKKK